MAGRTLFRKVWDAHEVRPADSSGPAKIVVTGSPVAASYTWIGPHSSARNILSPATSNASHWNWTPVFQSRLQPDVSAGGGTTPQRL